MWVIRNLGALFNKAPLDHPCSLSAGRTGVCDHGFFAEQGDGGGSEGERTVWRQTLQVKEQDVVPPLTKFNSCELT